MATQSALEPTERQSFVIVHDGHVGMFKQRMNTQHRIVWLDNSCCHLQGKHGCGLGSSCRSCSSTPARSNESMVQRGVAATPHGTGPGRPRRTSPTFGGGPKGRGLTNIIHRPIPPGRFFYTFFRRLRLKSIGVSPRVPHIVWIVRRQCPERGPVSVAGQRHLIRDIVGKA